MTSINWAAVLEWICRGFSFGIGLAIAILAVALIVTRKSA